MNEPRWITFHEQPAPKRGKTRVWLVFAKEHFVALGEVSWLGRWRCYGFIPRANTIYEKQCLRDIARFCEEQTSIHKANRIMERSAR